MGGVSSRGMFHRVFWTRLCSRSVTRDSPILAGGARVGGVDNEGLRAPLHSAVAEPLVIHTVGDVVGWQPFGRSGVAGMGQLAAIFWLTGPSPSENAALPAGPTSHAVAVRDGAPGFRFRRGRAQENETNLRNGSSGSKDEDGSFTCIGREGSAPGDGKKAARQAHSRFRPRFWRRTSGSWTSCGRPRSVLRFPNTSTAPPAACAPGRR